MVGRWLMEYLLHYPIIRLDGVDELLAIRLIVYFESRPSSSEFDLPAQFSITRKDIDLTFVATSIERLPSKLHTIAGVSDDMPLSDIFYSPRRVDPATVFADGKIRQNLCVFLLPQCLTDYLAHSHGVCEDLVDLLVEQAILVGLGSGDAPVHYACLVKRVQ